MTTPPILLIEKNKDDVALITETLAGLSASMRVFTTGEEALAFLAGCTPKDRPALVLLSQDSCTPGELDILRKIRADNHTRFLPVVILCPEIPLDHVLECYAAGANSVICKPINRQEFRDLVQLLGVYWTTAVRTPGPPKE